jgi:rhodanese-related sulfurtransferase
MKILNPLFLASAMLAKSRIKEIDVAQAKQQMDSEHPPVFIDVREDDEWQTGHLPHAVHLSKGTIEHDIEKKIPDPNTPLVLYCSGGYRSAIATDSLRKMGYTHICSMEGGCTAWANAGYPLQKDN